MTSLCSEAAGYQGSRLSAEFRLYAWSIILEPMLFFLLAEGTDAGISLTLARLVQAAFIMVFCARLLLTNTTWVIPNPGFSLYRYFTRYLLLLAAATFIGLFVFDTYTLTSLQKYDDSTFVLQALRGQYTRPFFEVVILLYYFLYFVVLPKYMIKSREEFGYLFKWLIRGLYFMLFAGFLDLVLQLLGWGYIPKHMIHTEFGYVGERFHALLGEPRDAFPYLLFILGVIYLKRGLAPNTRVPLALVAVVLLALLCTQSASGAVGLVLGAVGILIYFSSKSFHKLVLGLPVVAAVLALAGLLVIFSTRIILYVNMSWDLWAVLNAGKKLPYILAFQSANYLPFWQMWTNLKELNLVPVIFGSGIGTTSIINNNLSAVFIEGASSQLMNAHAQITRIVFESGVVGLLIYVMIFFYPVRKLVRTISRYRDSIVITFFLLLGVSLSHRSTTIFIYLGIVISLLENWSFTRDDARERQTRGAIVPPH